MLQNGKRPERTRNEINEKYFMLTLNFIIIKLITFKQCHIFNVLLITFFLKKTKEQRLNFFLINIYIILYVNIISCITCKYLTIKDINKYGNKLLINK